AIWWRQMLCEVPPLWSSTTPGPWSPARCTATSRPLCRNHSGDAPCGGPSLGFGDRCALLLTVASCTATSDNDHSPNGCYPRKVGVPTPTRQCFFLAHRRKPPRSASAPSAQDVAEAPRRIHPTVSIRCAGDTASA